MNYTIENDYLKVTVSQLGAELMSVVSKKDGCEYVWTGDEKYWSGRSPVLFPVCCRLFDGHYTYEGKKYYMGCHGFTQHTMFDSVEVTEDAIIASLSSNDEIRKQYPFEFTFEITYRLDKNRLNVGMKVYNKESDRELIFAVGGHPGFNVPLSKDTNFEDWYLEFENEAEPLQFCFTDTCFRTEELKPLKLEGGKILRLKHELFDNDAIFMSGACKYVTLKSDKSKKSVYVRFPKISYLGIWHMPRTDAPYICIEPMNGLPSYDGKVDDLTTKSDMVKLAPCKTYDTEYDIIFE